MTLSVPVKMIVITKAQCGGQDQNLETTRQALCTLLSTDRGTNFFNFFTKLNLLVFFSFLLLTFFNSSGLTSVFMSEFVLTDFDGVLFRSLASSVFTSGGLPFIN